MNRTKRIVAAILAIAMCAVLFAGCGTKTKSAKTGVEDGVLTVACRDEMVKNYLDCPEVVTVLESVTGEEAGCPVRVLFTLGQGKNTGAQHGESPALPHQNTGTTPRKCTEECIF